jgi:hypothetical protein
MIGRPYTNRKINVMKNILLIINFCSTIWSCSNQITDNLISTDSLKTKDNLITQADTAKIHTNANFSFGCADLTKFKYPKHWKGDLENYGQLKKPTGKEFEDIGKCFNAINSAKTIKSPRPLKLELMEIGDIFKNANNLDTVMQVSFAEHRHLRMLLFICTLR